MSNTTAGDPQPKYYYCPQCGRTYNYTFGYAESIPASTFSLTSNRDDEIIKLLKQILAKLEEIRMEL